MKHLTFALWLSLAMALGAQSAQAATPQSVSTPIKAGPVTLKPDRAYLLFRTNRPRGGLASFDQAFLRVPTAAEVANYEAAKRAAYALMLPQLTKAGEGVPLSDREYPFVYQGWPNVFSVRARDFFADAGSERTYLAEVAPGDYLVMGLTTNFTKILQTCHCMGTVGFKATAGVVTDLGTILSDHTGSPSAIPELAGETGLDKTALMSGYDMAQAVRPATDATPLPPTLAGAPRRVAEYYAVGPSLIAAGHTVDRLAPLAGVLRYEGPDAIDVKTGAILK